MDKLHLHLLMSEFGLINVMVQYHENVKNFEHGELIYKHIYKYLNKYRYQDIIIHTNNFELADLFKNNINFNDIAIELARENVIYDKEKIFQTYINGFTLAITGVYPLWTNYDGIKHVFGNGELPNSKLDFYRNINSTYIVVNEDPLFEKSNYLDVLELYFKNHVGAIRSKNLKQIKKIEYSQFSDREEMNFDFDTINVVTIDDEKNMRYFVQNIREIEEKGSILIKELNYVIKDECMWFGKEFCTANSKLRLFHGVESLFESPQCNCNKNLQLLNDYSNRIYSDANLSTCFKTKEMNQLLEYYKGEYPALLSILKIRRILKSFIIANKINSGSIEFPTDKKSLSNTIKNAPIMRNDYLIFKFNELYYLYIDNTMKFYRITYKTMLILEDLLQYNASMFDVNKIIEKR